MEPYDPEAPVICLDEMPVGLVSASREALPMRTGSDRKEDYEYVRGGSASVFAALDFKDGRRLFEVRERRTSVDFAHFLRRVVDELCEGAKKVRLVLDNLSTHSKAALYQAFEPREALRIARKLELHPTPKHGSWVNAVELEFAAAKKQCLGTHPGAIEELTRVMKAWQDERNEKRIRVRWTFDIPTAREKLKRIYPSNEG